MTKLHLTGLRLIATLPPAEHFGGANLQIARVFVSTLRGLGATIYEFDTSSFYRNDQSALRREIQAAKGVQVDAVISTPNAGYVAELTIEDDANLQNVFLDVLALPTICIWDHALIQAPRYVLKHWPSKPLYSKGNVKQALRALLSHPLSFHIFSDSGQVSEFCRLGVAEFDHENFQTGGASQEFINCGDHAGGERQFKHSVSFFGNLYAQASRRIGYDDQALTKIRERALSSVMNDWDYPAYRSYVGEIDALAPSLRARLRLDPDQSFYWRYLHDELSIVANGEPRFRKLLACGHPLTYFGGFADPESRAMALNVGWTLGDQYLPYGQRLAAAFRQSRISIDITNAPFINGFTSKFLECFVAGGFVLTSRKPDMRIVLGPLLDEIGFSSAEELASKVDRFLTHELERTELAQEIRELLRRDWSTAAMFARAVPLALDRVRSRAASGQKWPGRSHHSQLDPEKLGLLLFDIPLSSLTFNEGGSGEQSTRGLEFASSPQQWGYSLYGPRLCDLGVTGEAVVRIELQVRTGQLGIALAANSGISELVVEFSAKPSAIVRTIDIPVEDLAAAGLLIIRNQSDNGPSEATIRSIQVFRPEITADELRETM